jgi:hypothetical protein
LGVIKITTIPYSVERETPAGSSINDPLDVNTCSKTEVYPVRNDKIPLFLIWNKT